MSLEFARTIRKTVGAKQTLKAMKRNEVTQLYVAKDSEGKVVGPLIEYARSAGIPVEDSYTMMELGIACRIKVKAAAVGVLR